MSYSVQLYTIRHAVEEDLADAIRRLAEIGYNQVEPYNFVARADEMAHVFALNGITAPTGHAPLLSADQDEIFSAARRLGIATVIEPYITADKWQDAQAIQATAQRLNLASRKARAYGIRVGYHNHAWELEAAVEGVSALEYFANLLDPEVVLEVDTYWAAVGGEDPAALIRRLGKKVVAIHIKDGPVTGDTTAQLPAGQGRIAIAEVIAAAKNLEVGVVEFDDYTGDIFEGVAQSLEFLTSSPATSRAPATAGRDS